jgi:beta-lactamase class A
MADTNTIKSKLRRYFSMALLCASLLAAGVFIGRYHLNASAPIEQNSSSEVREKGYTFTNPLLDCNVAEGKINARFISFRSQMQDFINQQIASRKLSIIGFYFRDFNTTASFGINDQEEFIPASLLKVPIMMGYYKIAEMNPEILEKVIKITKHYDGSDERIQSILPEEEIQVGKEYTVDELIRRMLVYSDNQAALVLRDEIDSQALADVYKQLNIKYLQNDLDVINNLLNNKDQLLTVKTYSVFFRMLYNSSYLDRSYSEKALQILSQSKFRGGIVAGVPSDIPVAHKFGESGYSNERQLHDCGIVYFSDRHYMLCVMTRGKNMQDLVSVIQDISKLTYEAMVLESKME